MTMITQKAIEQGYKKMQNLPQDKLILLLGIIDQFSDSPASSSAQKVTLGIADGKYSVPENINPNALSSATKDMLLSENNEIFYSVISL